MCDIYECEFKLVGRKMANLNSGNISELPPSDPSCLQQKYEHSFDHFSSLKIRLREERGEKNIFEYKITQ